MFMIKIVTNLLEKILLLYIASLKIAISNTSKKLRKTEIQENGYSLTQKIHLFMHYLTTPLQFFQTPIWQNLRYACIWTDISSAFLEQVQAHTSLHHHSSSPFFPGGLANVTTSENAVAMFTLGQFNRLTPFSAEM